MTDITPPPELVQQWDDEGTEMFRPEYQMHLTSRAAQWGADQELEACCTLLEYNFLADSRELRAARRPRPPSLKERLSKAIVDGDEREALKLLEELDDSL